MIDAKVSESEMTMILDALGALNPDTTKANCARENLIVRLRVLAESAAEAEMLAALQELARKNAPPGVTYEVKLRKIKVGPLNAS